MIEAPRIPNCSNWNFQLSNFWLESLDYRYHQISLNKYTAKYEDDGSVFIVISEQDPGPRYPNWLRTLGYGQGGMLGRYVGSTNPPKEMASRIVKISELQAQT